MIPLIQRETVEKEGWISDEDILEIVAIAESTPGPIAINSATFVGYRVAGVFGSFCATLGVVLPSFIIISIIAVVLKQYNDIKEIQNAFYGIRAGVLALLVKALYTMAKKCPKGVIPVLIAAVAFILSAFTDISIIIIIIICALSGLVSSIIIAKKAGDKK